MSKSKILHCPNCNTPIYERIPKCPSCSYLFYEIKPEYGVEIIYDFLISPFHTMEKYANAIQFKSLLMIPFFCVILLLIYFKIDLVLNAVVPELIPWGKIAIDGFVFIVAGILWYFIVLGSLSIGMNLWNKPLALSMISQVINVSMIGLFYGLIVGILFRVINIRSVTFVGSAEDTLTTWLGYFFIFLGAMYMTASLYKGISFLTDLKGIKIFFISLLPVFLVLFFLVLTVVLFATGVYLS